MDWILTYLSIISKCESDPIGFCIAWDVIDNQIELYDVTELQLQLSMEVSLDYIRFTCGGIDRHLNIHHTVTNVLAGRRGAHIGYDL